MSLLIEQLSTFVMLIGAGLLMGLVFDIYRILRWLLKLPGLAVHLFDLLIWLVFAVGVFFILLIGNWGELRFYVFLGILIGLILYFMFLSKKIIKLILAGLEVLKKIGKFLIKVFTFPIKLIGTVLVIPLGIITFLLTKIARIFLWPTNILKKFYLSLKKELGGKFKKLLGKKR